VISVAKFVETLSEFTLENVFNPYRDICMVCDENDGAKVRRENLKLYLNSIMLRGVDSVWLGRDCGYRGARRTGVALTDDFHLETLKVRYKLDGIARATKGTPIRERTATEVWKILNKINDCVFLWNVFPFHPFEQHDPFSNRCHNVREFDAAREILDMTLKLIRPKKIIALGATAHFELQKLGCESIRVRHPSYGGHLEFASKINAIYSVRPADLFST
jgi:hypothetical protein